MYYSIETKKTIKMPFALIRNSAIGIIHYIYSLKILFGHGNYIAFI